MDSRVGGTISADVDYDLSRCLELMSATRRSSSQRYSSARFMQTAVDEDRQFTVLDTLWYSHATSAGREEVVTWLNNFEQIRHCARFLFEN